MGDPIGAHREASHPSLEVSTFGGSRAGISPIQTGVGLKDADPVGCNVRQQLPVLEVDDHD